MPEKMCDFSITILCTNIGGEFFSNEFDFFGKEHDIRRQ